jgi:hypothetical protein
MLRTDCREASNMGRMRCIALRRPRWRARRLASAPRIREGAPNRTTGGNEMNILLTAAAKSGAERIGSP